MVANLVVDDILFGTDDYRQRRAIVVELQHPGTRKEVLSKQVGHLGRADALAWNDYLDAAGGVTRRDVRHLVRIRDGAPADGYTIPCSHRRLWVSVRSPLPMAWSKLLNV